MPNSFCLIRKSDPDAGPVPFCKIDDEMCAHFGVESHPRYYHIGWYDFFGMGIACGRSFAELRKILEDTADEHALAVCDWLDANFTGDAWYTPSSIVKGDRS